MSAMNLASPWRGPMVDAAEVGFTSGNRAAAAFMYSGIEADDPSPPPVVTTADYTHQMHRRRRGYRGWLLFAFLYEFLRQQL